jgi:ATP-dependent Lon protease
MPLRDFVVFPFMMTTFVVGHQRTVRALEEALAGDRKVYLIAQRNVNIDDPEAADLFSVGTIANIVQSLKTADGNIKIVVEGIERAQTISVSEADSPWAEVRTFEFNLPPAAEVEALVGRVVGLFEEYVKLSHYLNPYAIMAAIRTDNPGKLADLVAANLQPAVSEKQKLLEILDPMTRLRHVGLILDIKIERALVHTLRQRVKLQMAKAQKK